MRVPVAVIASALALLVFAGTGSALRVTISPFDGAIAPGSAARSTDVTVRVDCEVGALDTRVREVTLAIDSAPDWAHVSIFPSSFSMSTSDCLNRNERKVALSAETVEGTRAFLAGVIGVSARETRDGSDLFDRATVGVIAGYQGKLSATVAAPLVVGNGFLIPVEVTNVGNAPTRVDVRLLDHDASWRVTAPRFFVLDSEPGGSFPQMSSLELAVSESTPGDIVGPGRLLIELTPHYLGGRGVGESAILAIDLDSVAPRSMPGSRDEEPPSGVPLLFALIGGLVGHAFRAGKRKTSHER